MATRQERSGLPALSVMSVGMLPRFVSELLMIACTICLWLFCEATTSFLLIGAVAQRPLARRARGAERVARPGEPVAEPAVLVVRVGGQPPKVTGGGQFRQGVGVLSAVGPERPQGELQGAGPAQPGELLVDLGEVGRVAGAAEEQADAGAAEDDGGVVRRAGLEPQADEPAGALALPRRSEERRGGKEGSA